MGIIATIIVGLLAGWIAQNIMNRDLSLIVTLVVGLIGSFIGAGVFQLFGFAGEGGWIYSTLVSVVGAVILLWLVGLVTGSRKK